jgi:hypothetical protein
VVLAAAGCADADVQVTVAVEDEIDGEAGTICRLSAVEAREIGAALVENADRVARRRIGVAIDDEDPPLGVGREAAWLAWNWPGPVPAEPIVRSNLPLGSNS